jgi:hypothetical protein
VNDLAQSIDGMAGSIESLSSIQHTLSSTTHEWLAIQSLGIDASEARLSRFLPVRIYLSDGSDDAVEGISDAVDGVLNAFGFEITDEFPTIRGSWFKKLFAKTADAATQPEVAERLQKIERAIELRGLGQPQAEIDLKQAEAVAKLMEAVRDVPLAAMQTGSILVIKVPGPNGAMVQARTLSQLELIHLENNQELLTSPSDLLERLSQLCHASAGGDNDVSPENSSRLK